MLLKVIGAIAGLIILVGLIILAVIYLAPQFGQPPGKMRKKQFQALENYQNGAFINSQVTEMNIKAMKMLREILSPHPHRKPTSAPEVKTLNGSQLGGQSSANPRLIWFGHSAFLLEMAGKVILIDPMLGERAAPFSFMGPSRYSEELPIDIDDLPEIDLVILSHDHYDHLDYGSIMKLKNKTRHFYTPLGVGSHLEAWGVDSDKIKELNWWDEASLDGINLVCTPARHFSGRALLDRNATLWCSWVISYDTTQIYFSGDGGYGKHFKQIGERYGPFDISLIECGQYNPQWEAIHMLPEQSVQAAIDLKSRLMMPIHWGAFTLAFHSWTEPVERARAAAKKKGLPMATPIIGESLIIGVENHFTSEWWESYY